MLHNAYKPIRFCTLNKLNRDWRNVAKKTSTSLMSTKLIVFGALFAREILRVDSPVSNIIYVPHVRPPRLPWRKCRDIFVRQHITRHTKKKATVRPLPLPKSTILIFINDPDRQNLIGSNFISWIYLFNITETSACQSFYVGKFNNSLQLTKSALSALYNFIPLILNRKFILFKNINHTNCSLFLGQAALTACLLVLVN